jgi:hypothetical protein
MAFWLRPLENLKKKIKYKRNPFVLGNYGAPNPSQKKKN